MDGFSIHVEDSPSIPASVLALLNSEYVPPTPWQTPRPPPYSGTHRNLQLLPWRFYVHTSLSGPQISHPLVLSLWPSHFTSSLNSASPVPEASHPIRSSFFQYRSHEPLSEHWHPAGHQSRQVSRYTMAHFSEEAPEIFQRHQQLWKQIFFLNLMYKGEP